VLDEGLLVCDRRGVIVHANAALEALIEAEPERRRVYDEVRNVAEELAATKTQEAPCCPVRRVLRTLAATYRVRGSYLAEDSEVAIVVIVERTTPVLPSAKEIQVRLGLTRKEAAVALLLAEGKPNEELAVALHISPHTARHHTESVLKKLCAHSRAEVGPALIRLVRDRT
jgi:DNA-binding CsgD family transcriptional regulator